MMKKNTGREKKKHTGKKKSKKILHILTPPPQFPLYKAYYFTQQF